MYYNVIDSISKVVLLCMAIIIPVTVLIESIMS